MTLPRAEAFIAASLDGYIARADGMLDWLTGLPVPEGEDFGYAAFVAGMDAILMGRATFQTACGFEAWPYALPVRVLSRDPGAVAVPAALRDGVQALAGPVRPALAAMAAEGFGRVYVDGGQVLTAALREGVLARLTITRVPVLLGAGVPLFGDTGAERRLRHASTRSWPNGFVQSVYDCG